MQDIDPMIGQRLGPYTLVDRIGFGGMAVVYRALDADRREVALKLLNAEYAAHPYYLDLFKREVETMRALVPEHPNIVRWLDVGVDAGRQYFVVEYLHGSDLGNILARWRRLPLPAAVMIARKVADALATVHRFGIVHRDVKPENIFIQPDGVVKVLDFGIAILRSAVESRVAGTPGYVAPDQDPDAPSDVFSLGCMLYEMLLNRLPGPADLAQRTAYREPDWSALADGRLPVWLLEVLKSMLSAHESQRLTARQVEQQLSQSVVPFPLSNLLAGVWDRMVFAGAPQEETVAPAPPGRERKYTPLVPRPPAGQQVGTRAASRILLQSAFPVVELGAPASGTGVLEEGRFWIGNRDGEIHGVQLDSGRRYRFDSPGGVFSSAGWDAAAAQGSLYLTGGSSILYRVDLNTGALLGALQLGDFRTGSITWWNESLYLVGGRELWQVSPDLSGIMHRYNFPRRLLGSPIVLSTESLLLTMANRFALLTPQGESRDVDVAGNVNAAWYWESRLLLTASRLAEGVNQTALLHSSPAGVVELMTLNGKLAGAPAVSAARIMLAFQHGEIIGLELQKRGSDGIQIAPAWSWVAPESYKIQVAPVAVKRYLAALLYQDPASRLVILSMEDGLLVAEKPVDGEPYGDLVATQDLVAFALDAGRILAYRIIERDV